jgi:hypothetical protein
VHPTHALHYISQEPLDLWPHLKPGLNILTINLAASPTIKGNFLQQQRQSHVDHPEEDDGYIFVLQTTEPVADHLKSASLRSSKKDPFVGFRTMVEAIATEMIATKMIAPKMKTIDAVA